MTCQTTWIQFSIRLSSCMFWAILDHGYKLRPNATPASDLDITEPFPTLPNHHLFIPNPPPQGQNQNQTASQTQTHTSPATTPRPSPSSSSSFYFPFPFHPPLPEPLPPSPVRDSKEKNGPSNS